MFEFAKTYGLPSYSCIPYVSGGDDHDDDAENSISRNPTKFYDDNDNENSISRLRIQSVGCMAMIMRILLVGILQM
jgi:hypothetical protein